MRVAHFSQAVVFGNELEVLAQNEAKHGSGLRIKAGLDLEEGAATVFKSHEDVEAGLVIEVAEGDVALLAGLRLEALVDEV